MTDKEKQAIETMKHWIDYEKANKDKINKADELIEIQETVLNLIEKKDKIIDEMAKRLVGITFSDKDNIEIIFDNKEDIKEYFKKKVSKP